MYEAFELQSEKYDLTGTRVYSSKPIAVFSGNKQTYVGGIASKPDHLVTQLVPVSSWGTEVLASSYFTTILDDVLRIATSNKTTVQCNTDSGTTSMEMKRGDYKDINLKAGQRISVKADMPIQVKCS